MRNVEPVADVINAADVVIEPRFSKFVAELAIQCEDVSEEENEFYWSQISEANRRYLLGPRNWPDPCVWCGGRLCHSEMCNVLHEHWAPRLEFGKHKGQRIKDVPTDYLQWLIKTRTVRDDDTRRAICRRLGVDDE